MLSQSVLTDERAILVPLTAVSFFQIVDMMIVNPLGAWIVSDLAIGTGQFSFLLLTYYLASAVAGLFAAPMLDRFDRRQVLFGSAVVLTLTTLAAGQVTTLAQLVVLRSLAGVCGGLVSSQVMAVIGDLVPAERRGQAIGVVMGAFGMASVVGVPLSLALAAQFGWRWAFLGIGAVGLPVAAMLLSLPSVRPAQLGASVLDRLAVYRANSLALLASACLQGSAFIIIPFIGLYYVSHVGVRPEQLGLIYVVGGGAAVLFMGRLGAWTDKWGAPKVYFTLCLLSFGVVLLLTNLGAFGPVGLVAAVLASTLFFCVMTGRGLPLNALLLGAVPAPLRGGFMSVNQACQSLAMGLSAAAGGWISSLGGGVTDSYQVNGAVSIALTLVAMFMVRQLRR